MKKLTINLFSLINKFKEKFTPFRKKRKLEQVNIIIGKFQPFTIGHLNCIKNVYNNTGLKTVILVIDGKVDEKHPFNKDLMTKMIKSIILHYEKYCADFIFVKNADIVKNIELLREKGYEPISWVCGTDRYNRYNEMIIKYGFKINLSPNFKVFCINRYNDNINATSVRESLKMGLKSVYISYTPQCIHYLYSDLKNALNNFYNLQV